MQILIYSFLTLSAIGIFAAVIIYFLAKQFHVHEDPRVDAVEEALPGANCGACGCAGCRNFAETVVKAGNLDGLFCPVGGNECMANVARIMGLQTEEQDEMVAVVRCAGSFDKRPKTNIYDSVKSCAIADSIYGGDTGCAYGCLGLSDCVAACQFDAIHIDRTSGLPIIIDEKCTSCGACVTACPRDIIELRKKGKRGMRVFVSCVNEDKGGAAMKSCKAACIGCGKCVKACPFDAITLENNLAYIDFEKCKLCRKCVAVCPTGAIRAVNFPVKKPAVPTAATEQNTK